MITDNRALHELFCNLPSCKFCLQEIFGLSSKRNRLMWPNERLQRPFIWLESRVICRMMCFLRPSNHTFCENSNTGHLSHSSFSSYLTAAARFQ